MAQSIDIISIFPEVFDPVLRVSITGRAISKGEIGRASCRERV